MRGRERAALRAAANQLAAAVHVGQGGVDAGAIRSLDDVLRTRELVKVQFSRHADAPVKDAARVLAEATGAEVVQVIGRTATFFRPRPAEGAPDGAPDGAP